MNLTWKFYGDVIVHLQIKEGYKSQTETISRELVLNQDVYGSMDEIIENFILPCNLHVQEIKRFPKFSSNTMDEVKRQMRMKKEQNNALIPYAFSFTKEKPQFLVLSYIPEGMSVLHELIKIKPDGLVFHGQSF